LSLRYGLQKLAYDGPTLAVSLPLFNNGFENAESCWRALRYMESLTASVGSVFSWADRSFYDWGGGAGDNGMIASSHTQGKRRRHSCATAYTSTVVLSYSNRKYTEARETDATRASHPCFTTGLTGLAR
jgi:hypothetical protein